MLACPLDETGCVLPSVKSESVPSAFLVKYSTTECGKMRSP
jgi:hypothetical protein